MSREDKRSLFEKKRRFCFEKNNIRKKDPVAFVLNKQTASALLHGTCPRFGSPRSNPGSPGSSSGDPKEIWRSPGHRAARTAETLLLLRLILLLQLPLLRLLLLMLTVLFRLLQLVHIILRLRLLLQLLVLQL